MDTEWEEELIAVGIPSDSEVSENEGPVVGQTRGQRKRRKLKDDLYLSGIAGDRP
jgi:hypothetical protein